MRLWFTAPVLALATLFLAGCETYPYETAFNACDNRAEACYGSCENFGQEEDYKACQADCGLEIDRCFDRAYAAYNSRPTSYTTTYYRPWYGRYGIWHPNYGYSFSVSVYNRYGYRRGVSRPGWPYYDPYAQSRRYYPQRRYDRRGYRDRRYRDDRYRDRRYRDDRYRDGRRGDRNRSDRRRDNRGRDGRGRGDRGRDGAPPANRPPRSRPPQSRPPESRPPQSRPPKRVKRPTQPVKRQPRTEPQSDDR